MADNERMNDRQLALIREFTSICTAASVEFWLRGGWAVDFFLGRITREHEDIDLFVWGKDAPRLMESLQHAGFEELGGSPPEAQRNVAKDGEELQIALLATNEQGDIVVAGGPWAGALQPRGMLIGPPGRLDDLVCPIVNPHVQVEIKEKFGEWRPDLPPSEKHQVDIARLRTALTRDDA
jgi:Aminoglycoside-2''-adenylyltransferase